MDGFGAKTTHAELHADIRANFIIKVRWPIVSKDYQRNQTLIMLSAAARIVGRQMAKPTGKIDLISLNRTSLNGNVTSFLWQHILANLVSKR